MSNCVWNNFGVLTEVRIDENFVWVSNQDGRSLKMSIISYKDKYQDVYQTALGLVGKKVRLNTSQSNGEQAVWFSHISEVSKRRAAVLETVE
ncbi:hypothetical protein [Vibrio tapetis]|uniref:Uncharacterized protein n=1 Tax=Vibrio tapetis subsp. tapetis TaxID=1671868 RepID=A0A2N8ZMF4_9VIBR|nr:hypothetical protein [Vibrio tapetis]SON53098.1 conserved protein of unknown function [Vibrio tapetis subsp. tapetis]